MKKAISPLLATVLLISLAIGIGYLMSNWSQTVSQTQTEKITEKMEERINCASSGIAVENITYDCSDGNFTIVIYNGGSVNLEDFKIIVKTTNLSTYTYSLIPESVLSPGYTNTYYHSGAYFSQTEISSVSVFSDTCPNDARINVEAGEINFVNC